MKERYKRYLKLNIIPLFFIFTSFIFTTLAWFAYSGLSSVETEIDVKAWHIKLSKFGESVSNNIVISLPHVYPGMDTISEKIDISNLGDSDAELSYSITSARILNETLDTTDNDSIEMSLAHDYPFHININLSNYVVEAKSGTGVFEVSVSWPLDSKNDELDSVWGENAYEFDKIEKQNKSINSSYAVRPSIQLVINVSAEQYVASSTASSKDFYLGKTVLYDVKNDTFCNHLSEDCLSMTVIDKHNYVGDEKITLLPNLYNDFITSDYYNYSTAFENITSSWNVETRKLLVDDLLNIISTDIKDSYIVGNDISNLVIGTLNFPDNVTRKISQVKNYGGYFKFLNDKFTYLSTPVCYWTDSIYDEVSSFAFEQVDSLSSKIYANNKNNICRVIPVVLAKNIYNSN